MSSNVRNQMLLGAAAGLLKGGGPSPTPNWFGGLAEGLQGALTGREQGQSAAYKQLLQSEQIRKLAEDRAQREQWQRIFAGGGQDATASPTPAPTAAMPPGIMSPPSSAPAPVQAPQGMPPGIMSPVPFTDASGSPSASPASPMAPPATPPIAPPLAAPSSTSTQAGVRADASQNLQTVLRNMPPAMRQMIGVMGPTKGMEALSTYVGKKFDKPSDSFLTIQGPDGKTSNFRADSPAVDAAIAAGGKVISTPSGKPSDTFLTVKGQDGAFHSYRADSPALDQAITAGGTVVTTPSSDPKTGAPSTTFTTVQNSDGSFSSFRADDPRVDQAITAGGKVVTTPSSNPNDHMKKPDAYLLPDGKTVLSADGRSYTDENGATQTIPQVGSIKLGPDTAYESSRSAKVEKRAQAELDAGTAAMPARPAAEGPATKGTGPWSALKGATDAVAGGIGVDQAFGKQGVFPETTANRQYLRNLRQVAKTALVNNPRFPVAEQKNVDELFPDPDSFWTNPHSEAQKLPIMRNMLHENLNANNEAIASGGLTKEERSKLTSNNIEIRRALRLVGEGDASLDALGPKPAAAAAKPTSWADVPVNGTVVQNGKTYKKDASGNAVPVP